jgi:hypothetical protein
LVAEDVARLLTSAGFEGARILMDQAGRCRVVQAARLK